MSADHHLLPVFVQPSSEIVIVASKPETYKQTLTLINPFDFTLKYKVLSNAPFKFVVDGSTGFVRSKCVVNIGVRHRAPTVADGGNDVLRVELFRDGQPQSCGRKDIRVSIVASDIVRPVHDDFRSFPPGTSDASKRSRPHTAFVNNERQSPSLFWFIVVVCVVSIIAVLLPTYDENRQRPSIIPTNLMPTQNIQLVAAFVLGVITVHLMRQND